MTFSRCVLLFKTFGKTDPFGKGVIYKEYVIGNLLMVQTLFENNGLGPDEFSISLCSQKYVWYWPALRAPHDEFYDGGEDFKNWLYYLRAYHPEDYNELISLDSSLFKELYD